MSKKTEEKNNKSNSAKEKGDSVLFCNPALDQLIDQVLYKEYSYMKKVLKQSGLEASLAYLANRQAESVQGARKQRARLLHLAEAEFAGQKRNFWFKKRGFEAEITEGQLFSYLNFSHSSMEDLGEKLQDLYDALLGRLSISEWCIARLDINGLYQKALKASGLDWKERNPNKG